MLQPQQTASDVRKHGEYLALSVTRSSVTTYLPLQNIS